MFSTQAKVTSFLPLIIFTITALLGVVELFTYQGVIKNYLGISYLTLNIFTLTIISFYRIFTHSQKQEKNFTFLLKLTSQASLLSFVICIIGAVFFFTLDGYTFPNYTFSQLGLNPYMALELSIFSLATHLLTTHARYLKKYGIAYFQIAFLTTCFYLYIFTPTFFISLGQGEPFHGTDDTFFKWTQFILLVLAAAGSFYATRISMTPLAKTICVIAFIGCIFLAGEEISWGQRQFNISSEQVEIFSDKNYQNETNIHNIHGINEVFVALYIFAFLYAIASYVLRTKVTNSFDDSSRYKETLEIVSFKGQEVFYLLPTFLFNPYINHADFLAGKSILEHYSALGLVADFNEFLVFMGVWREAFEVLFYAVILIRFVDYILYIKHTRIE